MVYMVLYFDLNLAAADANPEWIPGELAQYMLKCGYHLSRTGEAGVPAIVAGWSGFVRAVTEEHA